MRIVFMGTPEFALPSLKMLIEEGYEVSAVVTQPDKPKGRGNKLTAPPVKEYASAHGILVLQPSKVKTSDFADQLREIGPDLLVTAAYGKILPGDVLDIPPLGCINVHGSLLPKYRGAAPIHWAVINGEKVTGITTMYTDIGMDTGDMLLKGEVNITDNMTTGELHDLLAELGAKVLKETLKKLKEGTLERVPQNDSDATYAPIMSKEIGLIDWDKTSGEIHDLVRGTNPWPGAYTFYQGKRMRIWKTAVIDGAGHEYEPGVICETGRDGITVACGKGLVRVEEVQFESSRRMGAQEFWHNINEGEILG